MQTVFSNDGVAHAWASRSQHYGRSNNHNLYFESNVIYSYGNHFPIAMFHDDVVLFNGDSYSVSTHKHQGIVRRAVRHCDVVTLPYLGDVRQIIKIDDKATKRRLAVKYVKSIAEDIAVIEDKLTRMRSEWRIGIAKGDVASLDHAAKYVWGLAKQRGDCFNVTSSELKADKKRREQRAYENAFTVVHNIVTLGPDHYLERATEGRIDGTCKHTIGQRLRRVEAYMTKQGIWSDIVDPLSHKHARKVMGVKWYNDAIALQNKRDDQFKSLFDQFQHIANELRQQLRELQKVDVEAWKRGESVSYPRDQDIAVRVKDNKLQTSWGATVPLSDAVELTRAAIVCRKRGVEWKRNGETKRVGMFQTDRITKNGDLFVGCHHITWSEIVDGINRSDITELKGLI